MRFLPISLDMRGKRIVIAGGGPAALAKLRLAARTEARIAVVAPSPTNALEEEAAAAGAEIVRRAPEPADLAGADVVYAASGLSAEDARVAALARVFGAIVNVVDDRDASDFLTPAIVDRDPVTIAIGTEGAAPVLARRVKADVEERLCQSTGPLARIAERFRDQAATLPAGKRRRRFWERFFGETGPDAFRRGGEAGAEAELARALAARDDDEAPTGRVHFVGAGPGDPELLTLQARRLLHDADVVVYDRLAATLVLELARREAELIPVGKTPGGESWRQDDINSLLVEKAQAGLEVVRLKSGDPGVFGRLEEELDALDSAGVDYGITPGVTAATAAAAAAGVSLTRRGRNSAVRMLTGHDVDGFAEHDWRALAKPGAAAAIYMGVRAAGFIQGRLLMHGADPATPATVVENASRLDQKIVACTLGDLAARMAAEDVAGPAILLIGLASRRGAEAHPVQALELKVLP